MTIDYRLTVYRSFLFLIFLISFNSFSQIRFSGEATLQGMYSSKEELPFWMQKNQRGRITENTQAAGWLIGRAVIELDDFSSLEIGAGVLYREGIEDRVFLDESYVQFRNSLLEITGGRKQKQELYMGLSSTNENILWSLNARPLPGLEIQTRGPVFFKEKEGLGFEARWADYYLGRDRHVQDALAHHKMFRLVYQNENGWDFRLGIQHFAQWAGTSPDRGVQPSKFSDYIKIVSGRGGGEEAQQGDRNNALGNHLGSWELYVTKTLPDFKLGFIFNNIFEDGSGSRFDNFPDGRYGIYFENNEKDRLVNALIYEFYYTRHQSHDVNQWGPDNYFDHRIAYNSGWTYESRILGAPFFTYDEKRMMIVNNKFAVHHFGLSGQVSDFWNSYPYKLLISYAHNEGTFRRGIEDEDALHVFGQVMLLHKPFRIELQIASTFNNKRDPVFGGGLSLHKSF